MATTERAAEPPAADGELRMLVAEAAARRFGAEARLSGLERRPGPSSSSYRTEVVTARLDGRPPVHLFLKDFGARLYEKDSIAERRLRELRVYRELLESTELGTPEYWASAWDERRGRFWLLLEFVEGVPVRWCEFDDWIRAAAWLGRMQARFAAVPPPAAAAGFLVRHDEAFFLRAEHGARVAVARAAPALVARLDAALVGYGELVAEMARQPATLVHGGYRPQNLIRAASAGAARICVADWEEAALGSHHYDLAYFTDGFEPARAAVLLDATRREAARHGLHLPNGPDADRLLAAFNLHKNLGTLSKSVARGFPAMAIHKLVAMVEAAAARVR